MKATLTVHGVVNVAHEAPVWFTCTDVRHGHTYRINVQLAFDPSAADLFSQPPTLQLAKHLAELDGRDLNEMIRPARANHYGLAAWVMERMNRDYPVVMVGVDTYECEVELWADEVRRH